MSDTAIFISISTDELPDSGQLPGDLRSLKQLPNSDERIVHLEVISDNPLSEKTAAMLLDGGANLTVLPSASDTSAALTGGLMVRLHEFMCTYAHVSQFILAGSDTERLATPAAFLQRAGYNVIIAGTDRGSLDGLRSVCDDVAVWSGRSSNAKSGRDDSVSAPKLDPYEILVDEVTRGREKGQRVLLTSLKQRMRRRMRRFDETRLKDQEGRPMRKFKDFIADAANRDLIQLIEKGNASHVLLPGEEIPEDTDEEETNNTEEAAPRKKRPSRRNAASSTEDVDPLLDTVDMVEGDAEGDSEPGGETPAEEEQDLPTLTEADFDVKNINEDAPAPPEAFIELLEKLISENGDTLPELLKKISEKQAAGEWKSTNRELKKELQNSFYNELLEPVSEESPTRYVVVDDWKGIIDFL